MIYKFLNSKILVFSDKTIFFVIFHYGCERTCCFYYKFTIISAMVCGLITFAKNLGMTGNNDTKTTQQSAKKGRMLTQERKEFLTLRHRFGEKTSCKGQLTTSFQLVNSGKILSKDGRRVSTPYNDYRAWTAFLHFLIRFTRADQRNKRSWDTLFSYALAEVRSN